MSSPPHKQKLLLIGWDAADWKLITPLLDAGLMPNLSRLIESGVMGNLATLRPCLSPILWTSIATGKLADKHGILGFIEPSPDGKGVRLSSSTSRKTKAFWNILSQSGFKTHVVAWYASHPAEPISGVCVSDQFMGEVRDPKQPWPIPAGAVHPADLAEEIAALRVHPSEIGPTDLLPFVPRLAEIHPSDPRPAKLKTALAKTASVHALATAILDAEPWDVLAVYYDAIDVLGHDFMQYHPPRLPHISERDFELYNGVIKGLYQFHDMMLGRLMEMAGKQAAIVLLSDHGFHCDHLRPTASDAGQDSEEAALWHRHFGVLVMRGPNLKRDERVYGGTLLDITPTILHLLALPIGADMDGRILTEAFEHAREIQRIATWETETTAHDPGTHAADLRQDSYAAAAAIKQLVDLNYLPPETVSDPTGAAKIAAAEAQFNLSVVLMQSGRHAQAREILAALVDAEPEKLRYGTALANCLMNMSQFAECIGVLETLEAKGLRSLESDLLHIAALQNSGKTDEATSRLRDVHSNYPPTIATHLLAGQILLLQDRLSESEQEFRRATRLDDENEQAHFGLSRALGAQNKWDESAEHALRAVGLVHHFPAAHYQLGIALEGMGERSRAIKVLEAAVTAFPQFVEAHRHLARLYHEHGDIGRALQHERAVQGYGPSPKPGPVDPDSR